MFFNVITLIRKAFKIFAIIFSTFQERAEGAGGCTRYRLILIVLVGFGIVMLAIALSLFKKRALTR
jgi:hypothetical protein